MIVQFYYFNSLLAYTAERFLCDLGHNVVVCDFRNIESCKTALDMELIIAELNFNRHLKEKKRLEKLHAQHPEVPIILIDDSGSTIDATDAIRLGIHTCLRKPLRFSELEIVIYWLDR